MVLIRVQVLGCHALVRSDCFDNTGKTGSYVVIGLLPSNVGTEAAEKRIKLNQTAVVENNINPEFPENCTIFDLNAPEQRVYFDVYQCQHGKDDRNAVPDRQEDAHLYPMRHYAVLPVYTDRYDRPLFSRRHTFLLNVSLESPIALRVSSHCSDRDL